LKYLQWHSEGGVEGVDHNGQQSGVGGNNGGEI